MIYSHWNSTNLMNTFIAKMNKNVVQQNIDSIDHVLTSPITIFISFIIAKNYLFSLQHM
jgi:hypothetical protein